MQTPVTKKKKKLKRQIASMSLQMSFIKPGKSECLAALKSQKRPLPHHADWTLSIS
jgi:hypothetical protein